MQSYKQAKLLEAGPMFRGGRLSAFRVHSCELLPDPATPDAYEFGGVTGASVLPEDVLSQADAEAASPDGEEDPENRADRILWERDWSLPMNSTIRHGKKLDKDGNIMALSDGWTNAQWNSKLLSEVLLDKPFEDASFSGMEVTLAFDPSGSLCGIYEPRTGESHVRAEGVVELAEAPTAEALARTRTPVQAPQAAPAAATAAAPAGGDLMAALAPLIPLLIPVIIKALTPPQPQPGPQNYPY